MFFIYPKIIKAPTCTMDMRSKRRGQTGGWPWNQWPLPVILWIKYDVIQKPHIGTKSISHTDWYWYISNDMQNFALSVGSINKISNISLYRGSCILLDDVQWDCLWESDMLEWMLPIYTRCRLPVEFLDGTSWQHGGVSVGTGNQIIFCEQWCSNASRNHKNLQDRLVVT